MSSLTELTRLSELKCLYGETLLRLGGWPYHQKRLIRLLLAEPTFCFSCKGFARLSGSVRRMTLLPGTTFIRKAPCILISLNRGPYIACGNNRGGAYCGLWIINHVEIQTGCKDVTSAHMYTWEWRGGGNKANFPVGGSDSVKRPAIVARHVRH